MKKKELLHDLLKNFPELEKDEDSLKQALDFLMEKNPNIQASPEFKKKLQTRLKTITELKQGKKSKSLGLFFPAFGCFFVAFGVFFMVSHFLTLDRENLLENIDKQAPVLKGKEAPKLEESFSIDMDSVIQDIETPKNDDIQPRSMEKLPEDVDRSKNQTKIKEKTSAPVPKATNTHIDKKLEDKQEIIIEKKHKATDIKDTNTVENIPQKTDIKTNTPVEETKDNHMVQPRSANLKTEEQNNTSIQEKKSLPKLQPENLEDDQLFEMFKEDDLETTTESLHPEVQDNAKGGGMRTDPTSMKDGANNSHFENFKRICEKYGGVYDTEKHICTKGKETCNEDHYIAETCPFFPY